MIDICNLRLEEVGDWVRLVVDISSDFEREDKQDNIWVAVKKENASMMYIMLFCFCLHTWLCIIKVIYIYMDLCLKSCTEMLLITYNRF